MAAGCPTCLGRSTLGTQSRPLLLLFAFVACVESRHHFTGSGLKALEHERALQRVEAKLAGATDSTDVKRLLHMPAGVSEKLALTVDFGFPAFDNKLWLFALLYQRPWILTAVATLLASGVVLASRCLGPASAEAKHRSPEPAVARTLAAPAAALGPAVPPTAGQEPSQALTTEEKVLTQASTASGPPKVLPPVADRFSFGFARLLASLHVVLGHLEARRSLPEMYFYGWGFTWVPWFFMLSGFILFTAEARRPRNETVLAFVARRAVSIFPLYAFGLLAAVLLLHLFKPGIHYPTTTFFLESWLLQAWLPQVTEMALQMHCWFLSCMVIYWAAFRLLFQHISRLSMRGTLMLLLSLYVVPWLVILVSAWWFRGPNWEGLHKFGMYQTPVDTLTVILKYHPISYAHVFVLGMALGRLRLLLTEWSQLPRVRLVMEFLAPAGYLGLLLIFSVQQLRPWDAKLSARLVALLPLQAACLLGLAGLPGAPHPRIAEVLAPLNFFESYSYSVYVMQFICMSLWPRSQVDFWFFPFLLAIAVLAVHLVHQPLEKVWNRAPLRSTLLAPPLLFVSLVLVTSLPKPTWTLLEYDDLIRRNANEVDVRLPVELADPTTTETSVLCPSLVFLGDEAVVVSPTRTWTWHGSLALFADGLKYVSHRTVGYGIAAGTWSLPRSALASWLTTGVAPNGTELQPLRNLRTPDGGAFNWTCYSRHATSDTFLDELEFDGLQNPRPFTWSGSQSQPSDNRGTAHVGLTFAAFLPDAAGHCLLDKSPAQTLFVENLDSALASAGVAPSASSQFQCAREEVPVPQVNWIPFERMGKLHFVTSLVPHLVAVSGASHRSTCNETYRTSYAPLAQLLAKQPGLVVSGSSQAVFVDDSDATPSLPRPHYLALFAIQADTFPVRYAHFAYRFSAEPPFEILQVSAQLPLLRPAWGPFLASSTVGNVALRERQVVISYAAGESNPRALLMTLEQLDKGYFTAAAPGGLPLLQKAAAKAVAGATAAAVAQASEVAAVAVAVERRPQEPASRLLEVGPDGATRPWEDGVGSS